MRAATPHRARWWEASQYATPLPRLAPPMPLSELIRRIEAARREDGAP